MLRVLASSLLFILLVGCNLTPTAQPDKLKTQSVLSLTNAGLFTLMPVPSEDEIFELPIDEQKKFLSEYKKLLNKGVRGDKALFQYLEKSITDYTFDGKTHIAKVSLKEQTGNCISLAILTQSYANITGIETSFREVSTFPLYKKEDNLVMISTHFSTKLYAPKEEIQSSNESTIMFQFARAGIVVDYFPQQSTFYIGNAKYPNLVAKFYSNLATVALVEEDFDLSYSLISEALKFRPNDPELINLLAIIHRRAGDSDTAKKIFEFAVENNITSSTLYSSYHFLAKSMNDNELASELSIKIDKSAKTPYDFLQLAKKELKKKNYAKAEKIINSVIEEHFYLSEPYFELAKLHYATGRKDLAESALKKAIEMSDSQQMTGLYEAKLRSLEFEES